MENYSHHLRESLRVLKRRRGIIALTTLAFVMAALLFVILVWPRYTATAQLYVNLADPNGACAVASTVSMPTRLPATCR